MTVFKKKYNINVFVYVSINAKHGLEPGESAYKLLHNMLTITQFW